MPYPDGRRARSMTLKGLSRPCAISSASERCAELGRSGRLTGSLHMSPHAELTQSVTSPAPVTTRLFAASSWRAQRATSFVVQTTPLVGSASHFQCFLESVLNSDDRLDESPPPQRDMRWHNSYDQGVVGRVCARHFSPPWGVRQRLTAWQLTGRLSNARGHLGMRRRPTMMVKKMDIPPTTSARQAG